MKTIKLHSMKLRYFKGIRSLDIDFSDETNIYGKNRAGKTTVMSAFLWLLFDKDSTDRKDFGIKTKENGKVINNVDHSVEAVLSIDDVQIEVKKILSEKWVKRRGSEEAEFTGHETTYFWNGVPMRQMDFQKNIADICDEFVFRLITSPTAFNALHWEKRRNILMELAGHISDQDIAGDNPNYNQLVKELSLVKDETELKKKLNASVKKQKEELELIPARIDEVEKSKPGFVDFMKFKNDLHQYEIRMSEIENQISDSSQAYQAELDKINAHNLKINQVKMELDDMVYKAKRTASSQQKEGKSDMDDLLERLENIHKEIEAQARNKSSVISSISTTEQKISNIDSLMSEKRNEWMKVNAEHYAGDDHCPTCRQHLPEEMISEMIDEFNSKKQDRLSKINQYGLSLKNEKEADEQVLEGFRKQLEDIISELETKQETAKKLEASRQMMLEDSSEAPVQKSIDEIAVEILVTDADYQSKKTELEHLEESRPEQPVIDNSELKSEKSELQQKIDAAKIELNKQEIIKRADQRISELKEEQRKLSQEINKVDKVLFDLEAFTKLKVEEIERRIRDRFTFVSFKMFENQINGGIKPTCITLVKDGVDFNDANTEQQINAGVDIINALSTFYGVTAPIFLDNRESVTNVLPTNGQLINLIVSPSDLELRVENKESLELLTK